MTVSDENTQSFRHDLLREKWKDDAIAQKLLTTGVLDTAIEMLAGRKRTKGCARGVLPLDIWIVQAAQLAAGERDVAETMPLSQRKKLADTIIESTETLEEALTPFYGESGLKWPFQPLLDRLALDAACNQREWMEEIGIAFEEDTIHRCRYAVYRLLMHDLGSIFDVLRQSAELFASQETVIKKPNDKNADRLYFIRTLNKSLCAEFGSPCRSAAITITSAFFDCSDLDEAAMSKLAPHYRIKSSSLSAEDIDSLREIFKEAGHPFFLDGTEADGDPESNTGNEGKSSTE